MKNSVQRLGMGLVLLCCLFSGCAYTTRAMMPFDAQTIYVPIFRNETYWPKKSQKTFHRGIENVLTDSLLRGFLKDGDLQPVYKNKADMMLEGVVI